MNQIVSHIDNARHKPVMLREVIDNIKPADGEVYIDATFGAGGYSRALLDSAHCTVYGFDRDPRAIADAQEWAEAYGERLILINDAFENMQRVMYERGVETVDGIVFDLGVSSMQLDEADRGFSFRHDGPLSMRMDGGKPDAGDVVNSAQEQDLKIIFKIYGEEKRATSLARAIINARDDAPITTTLGLANIIEAATPVKLRHQNRKKPKGAPGKSIHPATRVFQALRIFVNDELGQLARALMKAETLLREDGRLIVVSFHSLEARIVKRFLNERGGEKSGGSRHRPAMEQPDATFNLLFRGQINPDNDETSDNVRARSASLRAATRTKAAPWPQDISFAGLPQIQYSRSLAMMEFI